MGVFKTVNSKILIVEDESIVASDLKQQIEHIGHKVVGIASNGKDAIKKCKETNPDLIFMDIMLKGDIDGIETAKIINKLYKIPHIYLTGIHDNTTLERSKTSIPSNYINKPFDEIEITKAIQKALYPKI
jgi:two-component system, response regulator PdtaR